MTDVEFVELRKIAENATPGPWEAETWTHQFLDEYTYGVVKHNKGELWDSSGGNCTASAPDAEFIAAANPVTVLGLLNRIEQAEVLIDKMVASQKFFSRLNESIARAERAEVSLQRVRELHQPQPGEGARYCADCEQRWPCPTITAIEGPQ